jgi:hypothetical protein
MANLLNQNIGTNYKGILNLNTLNGNLSGTLQAVTDGDGNASPLTLSTGEVGISRTIALSAGSSNVRLINETYTINNSGAQTGVLTGIFLNATETALNGMGHNLIDLQVGGVSRFRVFNSGAIQAEGTSIIPTARMGFINDPTNAVSVFIFANTTGATTFGGSIFRFNGTTNAFPAIKRNGAAIDFRLADDSGFCDIGVRNVILGNVNFTSGSFQMDYNCANHRFNNWNGSRLATIAGINVNDAFFIIGTTTNNASAIIQADSTTRGFLPPRMTTTQVDAITTPAAGLVVYSTTENALCLYNGSSWRKLNDSPL